ncbi:MAG: SHD1 domain-containing protein [Pirellulales bacterium]
MTFGPCGCKPFRSCLKQLLYAGVLVSAATSSAAHARTWTDSTGKYTVDADLVAFNERHVVLQKADHQLISVPLDKLSDADRKFLQSEEANTAANAATGAMQTWTLANGLKVVGRVVDYARRDVTLQRRRGNIYVNDRRFDNLPEIYQKMIPFIVAHFDRLNQPDREGLTAWLVRQRGEPRTFTVEGVVLELENGDEYGVPFFFFSDEDQQLLKPGWEEWLAAHEDFERQADSAFRLQSLAAAHQRDRLVNQQIAQTQLLLQAVQAGITSVWEVMLYPPRGMPQSVVVYGRNSRDAANAALRQFPGARVGPIRRVSN